jgi:hypothetical protein
MGAPEPTHERCKNADSSRKASLARFSPAPCMLEHLDSLHSVLQRATGYPAWIDNLLGVMVLCVAVFVVAEDGTTSTTSFRP